VYQPSTNNTMVTSRPGGVIPSANNNYQRSPTSALLPKSKQLRSLGDNPSNPSHTGNSFLTEVNKQFSPTKPRLLDSIEPAHTLHGSVSSSIVNLSPTGSFQQMLNSSNSRSPEKEIHNDMGISDSTDWRKFGAGDALFGTSLQDRTPSLLAFTAPSPPRGKYDDDDAADDETLNRGIGAGGMLKGLGPEDSPSIVISSLASIQADQDYNYAGGLYSAKNEGMSDLARKPMNAKDRARHGMLRTILRKQLEPTRPNWPKHPNMVSTDRLLDDQQQQMISSTTKSQSQSQTKVKKPALSPHALGRGAAAAALRRKIGRSSKGIVGDMVPPSPGEASGYLMASSASDVNLVLSHGGIDAFIALENASASAKKDSLGQTPSARNYRNVTKNNEPFLRIYAGPAPGMGSSGSRSIIGLNNGGSSPKGKHKNPYSGTLTRNIIKKGFTTEKKKKREERVPLNSRDESSSGISPFGTRSNSIAGGA
jgi:hypothetical protein